MIAVIALAVWLYLVFAHGRFWASSPEVETVAQVRGPAVDIVVPARDEAETIADVIASLRAQDYLGDFRIILVDDNSSDGTATLAGTDPRLRVLSGQPKPDGWSGKLWALQQGVAAGSAPLMLFTDADIVHDPRHLSSLVARLEDARLDLLSEMVHLNCASLAERALVPAFVYFFQMLYPFAHVNDPRSNVAAAAGGTILIRREALTRSGGLTAIRGALIDDVSLANMVKRCGRIELAHSTLAASVRPYPGFGSLWRMISRTAFTQLRYSALLLAATLAGMLLVWLVPVGAMLLARGLTRAAGACAFVLAAASYLPTLARYRQSPLWGLCLPLIALFYIAATLGSAMNHWIGSGARWKDRSYERLQP